MSGAARGRTPRRRAAAYDESWDDILLQRLRTAARSGRSPDRGPVAELRRHDRAHETEYVATLQAWLEAQGDPAEAGERLGVHENTVRYRLRKMAEIANLQLDDAKKRLAMMIELAAPKPTDQARCRNTTKHRSDIAQLGQTRGGHPATMETPDGRAVEEGDGSQGATTPPLQPIQ